MKNKYRVVSDEYFGFEVQINFWWLPGFWFQCFSANGLGNSHDSLNKAKKFIENRKVRKIKKIYYSE
jgi:hypothetical protein